MVKLRILIALFYGYNSGGAVLRRYVHSSRDDDPQVWLEGGYVIASGAKVKDAPRLVAKYGGTIDDWSKVKSESTTLGNGVKIETHAYQNSATGQVVEQKAKIHFPKINDRK